MPHIHTEPGQHDLVASAFIVRTDTHEPSVLLHWHKKLKAWLQFGGHVELDETPWQAITHELEEESGYTLNELRLLQPPGMLRKLTAADIHPSPFIVNTHAFDATHNHTDIDYAFTATRPPKQTPHDGESKQMKLFTRQQIVTIPAGEIPESAREICLFLLDDVLNAWDQMPATDWGVT